MSTPTSGLGKHDHREAAKPPVADVRPIERIHHGDTFVDDYEWLRDKTNPEVIAHLEAENAYTEARTDHLADLRQAIFEEI
jgi:oligopeptidase B